MGTLGLWVGLSDHRPLLVSLQNLPHDHLHSVPRFNKEPGSLRHLHNKRLAPSSPQLQKFKDQLSDTWKPLLSRPESSAAAAAQLEHLTNITLEAAPERKQKGGTVSNITGVLPMQHYKLNYLPC